MNPSADDFAPTVERFTGWADLYDRHRPEPPAALAAVLARLSGIARPELVADLGSGTGLSTRYWARHAGQVIGIEPSADMRRVAAAQTPAANVSYREGFSHATGLPDAAVALVSVSQALHWMEPDATFREAARILRRGGAFAAYDYDWPPTTGSWEVDVAYADCLRRAEALEAELKMSAGLRHWRDKERHLARMQASGCFRHTKEVGLHHTDTGNADRLVGILLGQGVVAGLMKRGRTESELGIDRFRELTRRALGPEPRPWYWSSRVRIGIV
jgi:SAM-dependent methyltransferase